MCDFDILFDIYKKSIDITENEKIKHMPQLLGHFYNYLNSIILVYSDEISRKEIENRKTKLITNINIIIDFYSPIDIKIKQINFQINYLLIDLMTLAIIILYSYIYVIDNIKTVSIKNFIKKIITKGKKHYTIKELLPKTEGETDIIANDKFLRKMIIEILNKIDKDKYKEYKEDKIYDILKYKIYTIDINKNLLYDEINTIINKFIIIYNIKSDEIITIVQYEGICWFTAFLTCICYSDANRKIIYNKINTDISQYLLQHSKYGIFTSKYEKINTKLLDKELFIELSIVNDCIFDESIDYNILFKLFLYIIIKYISNDKKKYTEYHNIILNLINNIIRFYPFQILQRINIVYNTSINGMYNHSDYNFLKSLKNYNVTIVNGLYDIDSNFYNIFYKILDIQTIFLIKYLNNYYIFKDIIIDNTIIPDIFLINYTNFIYKPDIKIFNLKIKINDNNNELTYNGEIYELDYILFINDKTIRINKNKESNSGHVVSAITYHNDEYYHDTRYSSFNEYKNRRPCPFIKQKWKGKKIGRFCLKKCFYTKINIDDKISKIIKNSTDDMCYNYNNGYICCYVKKTTVKKLGGNNEKLKSTNKKINIIIDNKKIQRTVYINNNGIKVIKYNNKLIKIYNK